MIERQRKIERHRLIERQRKIERHRLIERHPPVLDSFLCGQAELRPGGCPRAGCTQAPAVSIHTSRPTYASPSPNRPPQQLGGD